jgi:arylsulfatase A-like enzyme
VGEIEPTDYWRYYYQLHKNVDQEMGKVMDALLGSRFSDNTIVIFTSDHGDVLGSTTTPENVPGLRGRPGSADHLDHSASAARARSRP